jgi:hypothetical protein
MSSFNALTKSPVQAPAERHRATSASPVLKVHKELALCVHGGSLLIKMNTTAMLRFTG